MHPALFDDPTGAEAIRQVLVELGRSAAAPDRNWQPFPVARSLGSVTEEPASEKDRLERFEIRVEDAALRDLRERLSRTRFPDQLEGAGWDYGTELGYLRELCAYWRERFDWRERERALNSLPQYRAECRGLRLHFVHARSSHADAFPLLLTHGWPGSCFEFHRLIPLLTHPEEHGGQPRQAFHVVAPSLPGFAWSAAPRTRGFDARCIAEVEADLMNQLGYARYGAQGGDWGALITSWLGALDPHVAGIHLNMVVGGPPAGDPNPEADLDSDERVDLADLARFRREESGYHQIQGTRPQSLAYALQDSPAGLAAWIVEKFRAWSDCNGDVESRFSKDELLTQVMIYWLSGSIASSMRIYYEMRIAGANALPNRVEVPTACAVFPREIYRLPRRWAESRYNVKRWMRMPRGGHFAALEEPTLLCQDLREFFSDLR
jgi:pimeloyl-ACP methyl ester carboxylesterase